MENDPYRSMLTWKRGPPARKKCHAGADMCSERRTRDRSATRELKLNLQRSVELSELCDGAARSVSEVRAAMMVRQHLSQLKVWNISSCHAMVLPMRNSRTRVSSRPAAIMELNNRMQSLSRCACLPKSRHLRL